MSKEVDDKERIKRLENAMRLNGHSEAYIRKVQDASVEIQNSVHEHLNQPQSCKKPCNKACSPSDYYKGGKCDKNGCYDQPQQIVSDEDYSKDEEIHDLKCIISSLETKLNQTKQSELVNPMELLEFVRSIEFSRTPFDLPYLIGTMDEEIIEQFRTHQQDKR